jgi:hypothetical protein
MGRTHSNITKKQASATSQSPIFDLLDFIFIILPNAPFAEFFCHHVCPDKEYDADHGLENPDCRR